MSPQVASTTSVERGYALLHGLLKKEANADKLLWIKLESDDLDLLMGDISTACAEARDRLVELLRPQIDLSRAGLPLIELEVREDIESDTAWELIGAKGKDFEAQLLLTQLEALRYAANLCRVLARNEKFEVRKVFLEGFGRKATDLRARTYALLVKVLSQGKEP